MQSLGKNDYKIGMFAQFLGYSPCAFHSNKNNLDSLSCDSKFCPNLMDGFIPGACPPLYLQREQWAYSVQCMDGHRMKYFNLKPDHNNSQILTLSL